MYLWLLQLMKTRLYMASSLCKQFVDIYLLSKFPFWVHGYLAPLYRITLRKILGFIEKSQGAIWKVQMILLFGDLGIQMSL